MVDWKQEIKKTKRFGWIRLELAEGNIDTAIDELLELADTHHARELKGIKEHFNKKLDRLENSHWLNQEEISQLEADKGKLEYIECVTCGKTRNIEWFGDCGDCVKNKITQERQAMIEKIDNLGETLLDKYGYENTALITTILEELKKSL